MHDESMIADRSPSPPARRTRPLVLATALAALSIGAVPLAGPQEGETSPEGAPLWIHAERLIVRPGVELEGGAMLVRDGRIVAVGTDVAAPEGARRVEGRVACAGFVDPWSTIGLDPGSASDSSTSASTRSVDGLDPYRRADLRAEALAGGVTSARVQAGVGSALGGVGTVISTEPATEPRVLLEDACVSAVLDANVDVFDRIGQVGRLVGWLKKGEAYGKEQIEYRHELAAWEAAIAERREELEDDFKKAKKKRDKELEEAEEKGKEFKEERYKEDKKPKEPRYDADDEVLARVADGELPLVVEAHSAPELQSLLGDTEELDRLRLVLAGASEAEHLADELALRHVPVILWPNPNVVGRGAYRSYDLSLAGELDEAGVEVLLGSGGSVHARDLRLLAALAVGHGLDPEAALHAITLGPARAFDVAERVGTLERGKQADVLVFDGDPLDTRSRLEVVVSRGRVVGP